MAVDDEIRALKLQEGGNAIEHVWTLKRLYRRLEGTGLEVNETRKRSILLSSLPPSYEFWITLPDQTSPDNSDTLRTRLETLYRSMRARSESWEVGAAHTGAVFPSSQNNVPLLPVDLTSHHRLTGAKNPALAERARNTCRDCLQMGHRAGTP